MALRQLWDTCEVTKLQRWLTGDLKEHNVPQCIYRNITSSLFNGRSQSPKDEIIESKTIDIGSHLSKLLTFTCSLSSYSQQLLLQHHKSGSSETRAELHITWYTASERTAHPALLAEEGHCFLKKQEASIRTPHACAPHRDELPVSF